MAGAHSVDLFYSCNITDEGIKALAGVHTIDLTGCDKITNKGIEALAKEVRVIYLYDCQQITGECIKLLTKIHTIGLTNGKITDEDLQYLKARNVEIY